MHRAVNIHAEKWMNYNRVALSMVALELANEFALCLLILFIGFFISVKIESMITYCLK